MYTPHVLNDFARLPHASNLFIFSSFVQNIFVIIIITKVSIAFDLCHIFSLSHSAFTFQGPFLCSKMGQPRLLFFFTYIFSTDYSVQWFYIQIADDWIRTRDLWCKKQLLRQLCHNHCSSLSLSLSQLVPSQQFNLNYVNEFKILINVLTAH